MVVVLRQGLWWEDDGGGEKIEVVERWSWWEL